MARMDLHLHSACSLDGEISPRELADLCNQAGITLASLTDHNTVAGIPEFSWRCAQLGIRAVPGVELDCFADTIHLHILGYGIDIANEELLQIERSVRSMQRQCAEEQMEAVENLGIFFDRERVLENSKDGAVSAEMIAEAALDEPLNQKNKFMKELFPGGQKSEQPLVNFYWELCAPGRPAHVPMSFISAEQAISVIHKAGGIAVLAHPGASLKEERNQIDSVLDLPLDGIEVFSSYHTALISAVYMEKARQRGLLMTCGTDYHGSIKPKIQIGDMDLFNLEEPLQKEFLCALEKTSSALKQPT